MDPTKMTATPYLFVIWIGRKNKKRRGSACRFGPRVLVVFLAHRKRLHAEINWLVFYNHSMRFQATTTKT
jgi:hypothetical protein